MFLSLISFDKTIENAKFLNNLYNIHQLIWEGFEQGERDFLFRLNKNSKAPKWLIYILSNRNPNLEKLEEKGKSKLEGITSQKKVYKPKLNKGDILKFFIRINPTIKKNGKRIPLQKDESILKWLNNKEIQHGFKSYNIIITNKSKYYSFKKNNKMITHFGADVDGILKITDIEKFMESQYKGIGPAKSFGFGLMSIKSL